ncbi:hypothetical protein HPB49_000607 [Dermacentor silvarum]|uniref:Uncharacterized protein n=1 Tax=Dermacentor silvarum TaxID=543639 RepID=A0ACB8DSN4_DERSI|nr:hypothetical protein HPB49_000607 [Dermacentor silvarum]
MCTEGVEMLAVVVLLLCKAIVTESTCLDSDILYVRRLDAPKQTTSKSFQVFVNASDVVGVVKPFWKSTGFCPPEPHNDPEFFLGDDMQQNLIYIASVPGYGTTQVRMHWLLDLVNASTSSEIGGSTTFDFSLLDTLLDRLRALGLKPGLELMGNPFPRPLDFEERADLDLWKELVAALARHYLGLCNYYDACSEGLNEASPLLRLGGPAENLAPRHRSPLAWALLDHCERGARLDFISIHQKGNASTADIVEAEMEALSRIRERCPSLSTKPCINNEADPIKNWAEPYPWRADATYAAMLARLVKSHLSETGTCDSLSSDNGFLSYPPQPFSQRTQLARFRMNLTEPYVLFVRKPVHAVQALLGKLASRAVYASARALHEDDHGEPGPQLDLIATASGSYSLSALLYYSNESTWEPGIEAKVSVRAQLDWSTVSVLCPGRRSRKSGLYGVPSLLIAVSRVDDPSGQVKLLWLSKSSIGGQSSDLSALVQHGSVLKKSVAAPSKRNTWNNSTGRPVSQSNFVGPLKRKSLALLIEKKKDDKEEHSNDERPRRDANDARTMTAAKPPQRHVNNAMDDVDGTTMITPTAALRNRCLQPEMRSTLERSTDFSGYFLLVQGFMMVEASNKMMMAATEDEKIA